MRGLAAEAAQEYAEAWAIDKLILDPNVRLASIFHDPLPGCLAKHGRDAEVLRRIDEILQHAEPAAPGRAGLWIRRVAAVAWVGARTRQSRLQSDLARQTVARELVRTCRELLHAAPQDGHAALFLAAAQSLREEQAAGEVREAWDRARRLQEDSKKKGTTDTLPLVFDEVHNRLQRAKP